MYHMTRLSSCNHTIINGLYYIHGWCPEHSEKMTDVVTGYQMTRGKMNHQVCTVSDNSLASPNYMYIQGSIELQIFEKCRSNYVLKLERRPRINHHYQLASNVKKSSKTFSSYLWVWSCNGLMPRFCTICDSSEMVNEAKWHQSNIASTRRPPG